MPWPDGVESGVGLGEKVTTGGTPGCAVGGAKFGDVASAPGTSPLGPGGEPGCVAGADGSTLDCGGLAVDGGGVGIVDPSMMRTDRELSSSCAIAGAKIQKSANSAPEETCRVRDNVISCSPDWS